MTSQNLGKHYSPAFFDKRQGSLSSAQAIVPLVLEMLPSKSVVDIGCGTGEWLKEFSRCGVERILGLDGEYVDRKQLAIDGDAWIGHNLEMVLPEMRSHDLAVSLEVAEHLTPSRAGSFVSDLCKLSDAVLFSAAIPFQGGVNHLNEQWQSFWAKKFLAKDFDAFDVVRPRIWGMPNVSLWYKQNILLYAKQGSSAWGRLKTITRPNPELMDVVHPSLFAAKMRRMYARGLLGKISIAFRPKIRRGLANLSDVQ